MGNCVRCNKDTEAYRKRYCGDCAILVRRERQAVNRAKYRKARPPRRCGMCDTEVPARHKYCEECNKELRRRRYHTFTRGKRLKKYNDNPNKCVICGEVISYEHSRRQYCPICKEKVEAHQQEIKNERFYMRKQAYWIHLDYVSLKELNPDSAEELLNEIKKDLEDEYVHIVINGTLKGYEKSYVE